MDTAFNEVRTLDEFAKRWPELPWDRPVQMPSPVTSETHYACRMCLAQTVQHGVFRAREIEDLPTDVNDVLKHIREEH